jgi:hypothetical protein
MPGRESLTHARCLRIRANPLSRIALTFESLDRNGVALRSLQRQLACLRRGYALWGKLLYEVQDRRRRRGVPGIRQEARAKAILAAGGGQCEAGEVVPRAKP